MTDRDREYTNRARMATGVARRCADSRGGRPHRIRDDPLTDDPWCRNVLPELDSDHWQRFLGVNGVIGEHDTADTAWFILMSDTSDERV